MAWLIERAKTGEIFAAQRLLNVLRCRKCPHITRDFGPVFFNALGGASVYADAPRIAPHTRPRDAHRVRRHPPTLRSLALDSHWHCRDLPLVAKNLSM